MSNNCRFKSKPKAEWVINKMKQEESHMQKQSSDAPTDTNLKSTNTGKSTTSTLTDGWAGVHIHSQFYQSGEMRDAILLDNQSTASIFCNKELVYDIHTVAEPMILKTNGGDLITNMKATVKDFGEVWYNPHSVTNIFSMAEMEGKYNITYTPGAFTVHLPHTDAVFKRNDRGLYTFKPPKLQQASKQESMLEQFNALQQGFNNPPPINSVEENKLMFTDCQVERAKAAQQLYHALGTPSTKDFKAIITMNAIRNLPITIEDVNLAEKIFRPDIGALKGKTTRSKPAPVVADYIEIPQALIDNHHNVTLCMDTIKINGLSFLTTISRHIMYRTVEWLESRTPKSYRSVLNNVFRIYNQAGFRITTIHCDNEYQPLMLTLQDDFGISMNYANPQEHVPEAERNNRVIKERFRSAFHRLPFTTMPKIMVKILAMECGKKLNFFPPKGGISEFYSPRMIMHQESLDYNKHCSIAFGTYVKAHQEPSPTNTQHPRTLDCIYRQSARRASFIRPPYRLYNQMPYRHTVAYDHKCHRPGSCTCSK
jgi:hypothetical protein